MFWRLEHLHVLAVLLYVFAQSAFEANERM